MVDHHGDNESIHPSSIMTMMTATLMMMVILKMTMILMMMTMLTYANPSYCHCSQLCRCLFADLPSEKGQFKVSFSISLKIFTFLGDLCLNISWLVFLVGKVGGWSPWELVGSGTRSVIV